MALRFLLDPVPLRPLGLQSWCFADSDRRDEKPQRGKQRHRRTPKKEEQSLQRTPASEASQPMAGVCQTGKRQGKTRGESEDGGENERPVEKSSHRLRHQTSQAGSAERAKLRSARKMKREWSRLISRAVPPRETEGNGKRTGGNREESEAHQHAKE